MDENNWNNNNINDFCSGFLKQNNYEKNFKKLQSDYEKLIEKNEFVKIFQKKNKIDFAKIVSDWLQKDQGINPRLSYNIQDVQYNSVTPAPVQPGSDVRINQDIKYEKPH